MEIGDSIVKKQVGQADSLGQKARGKIHQSATDLVMETWWHTFI